MAQQQGGRAALLEGVSVRRGERRILEVDRFEVGAGERWALLGPNGSGKSTLLSILAGRLWPTAGEVELLGERLGHVDLRQLRPRLGLLSASLTRQLRPALEVHDVVVTGVDGALEPWWRMYSEEAHAAADRLLEELGVGHLRHSQIGLISEGERAQVLLARVLIARPEALFLDEPAAGLDLGARERFLVRLGRWMASEELPLVLVTHHLEELPVGLTHAALLREGRLVAAGPIAEVLSSELVSAAFDVEVEVLEHEGGRYGARSLRR